MTKIQTPNEQLKSILERLDKAGFSSEQSAEARRIAAKALQPLAWRDFLVTARLEAVTGSEVYNLELTRFDGHLGRPGARVV